MKHKRPGTSFKAAMPLLKHKEVAPSNERMFNSTMNPNKPSSKMVSKPTRKKQ